MKIRAAVDRSRKTIILFSSLEGEYRIELRHKEAEALSLDLISSLAELRTLILSTWEKSDV